MFLYSSGVESARARVETFRRLHLGPFAPGMRSTGERLARELSPIAEADDAQGVHETAGCFLGATGWVWDRTQPNRPVRLDIFDGDERLDTVTAGWFDRHLLAARMGNGRQGRYARRRDLPVEWS
jgi:hypothetical protein